MSTHPLLMDYRSVGDSGIQVWHVKGEDEYAADACLTLAGKQKLLLRTFCVEEVFPLVRAVLVPNRDEFDRLVKDLLRIEIEVPSHPARIAQPQRTDMIVLSPTAYAEHSTFEFVPEHFRRLLAHEFVHMIEEFLSPDIEASPGWWSEGLAVYFSEQSAHEDGFRGAAVDAIVTGSIPALARIMDDGKLAYDWGWTLVQYLDAVYGRDVICRIVRECADGNVLSCLGVGQDAFEEQWLQWLRDGEHLRPPSRT